jgi:isopenicillin-N epimerase
MAVDWQALRQQHMLDPNETYLNTGSFGSLHQRTLDCFVDGLRELETNPTRMHFEFLERGAAARAELGRFLRAPAEDLAFTTNVTVSMNMALLGLDWQAGDEILASDHEYGSVDYCVHQIEERHGVVVKRAPIPQPPADGQQVVDAFTERITPRTKLLLCSHVFSRTGGVMPIGDLARLAHAHGAVIAVDGAHAPGMFPLDLSGYGCDLYGGNCHKWLCSPKGVGFLYATPEVQTRMHHIVVGWGYDPSGVSHGEEGGLLIGGQPFMWGLEKMGSRDLPSLAATGVAVQVQEEIGLERIATRGRELAGELRQRLEQTSWAHSVTSTGPELSASLTAYHLDGFGDLDLNQRLYDDYRIWAPAARHDDGHWIRVSTHYYNDRGDLDRLIGALEELRRED